MRDERTPRPTRRTFVTAGAAGGATCLFSTRRRSPAAAASGRASGPTCWWSTAAGPDEITPTLTRRLAELRTGGLNYPRATSLPVMETIPNHVMMMTGLRPDRTGVPANSIYDRAAAARPATWTGARHRAAGTVIGA